MRFPWSPSRVEVEDDLARVMTNRRGNMRAQRVVVVGWVGLFVVAATPVAFAHERWGKPEQAKVCEKEYGDSDPQTGSWGGNAYQNPKLVLDAIKAGKVSPECRAEIDKRAAFCVTDKNYDS